MLIFIPFWFSLSYNLREFVVRTVIDLTKEFVCVRCFALSHSSSLCS
jgi:hypothetical protein